MTIKTGDHLPEGNLAEFIEVESAGCAVGPNSFSVAELVKGKTIAILAVPGAFTPTCSVQHLPAYRDHFEDFKAKGVDEIWCISVNDPFVMGAWGRDQKVTGKIRMMADGSCEFTEKLGMTFDLVSRGLGMRSQRYSMLVKDGVVTQFNLDAPGKFEVSDAATLLKQLA